jgi:uncharacterized protein (DUF4415 family)
MPSACVKQKKSNRRSTMQTSDEASIITQADLDRARFRVGLKDAPRKQRINIMLDTGVIAWFKERAGDRGYQTLISETLKQAISHEDLETTLRQIIREEMKRAV